MPCRVVLGAQWGDEGKGKVVDLLSDAAELVVRFQGGANAGHTLVTEDHHVAVHLVPSGVLNPACTLVLGAGMVVDPVALLEEIDALEGADLDVHSRLRVSTNAHLVMPYHKLQDAIEERRRGGSGLGTTGRGIGPAYADKAARFGIPAGLLRRPLSEVRARLRSAAVAKRAVLAALDPVQGAFDVDRCVDKVLACADRLRPLLADTTRLVHEALDAGRSVLLEGAQGAMLDLDHGTYPFVTSSSCTIGGALAGAGLAPADIDQVTGVMKAYTTRVGSGPFPTEELGEAGARLRERGREFGATTGRPRRCGWFDAVAARHAARVSGLTEIVLTKLDVLDGFERLRVATAYTLDDARLEHFPAESESVEACRPAYVSLPGWQGPTSGCREAAELPVEARRYVRALEEYVGVPVRWLSVGPQREHTFPMQG